MQLPAHPPPTRHAARPDGYLGYLILVIGFVSVIFHTTGSLVWNTNSDQLTIPSILEDVLHNPTGLDGWQFSRAPYFFPDLFVYGSFKLLAGGLWLPMVLTVIALNCVFCVAATELTRRAVRGRVHAGVPFGLLIVMPALATLSPELAKHVFVYQFSLASHFSMAVVSLTLVTLSVGRDERRLVFRVILAFLLAFLVTLSDKIVYVYLIAPWLITLIVLAWIGIPCGRRNGLSFAAVCAGALAARSVEPYVRQQSAVALSLGAPLRNARMIASDFLAVSSDSLAVLLLFLCVFTTMAVSAYRMMRSAARARSDAKEDPPASTRAFVHVFLLSGSIVSVASLAWVYDEVGSWRYLMAFIYYPIVLLSIGLHRYIDDRGGRITHARSQAASVVLLAVLALAMIGERRLQAFPGKVNVELVTDYDSCRSAHGLHAGLASYWFSRKINMLSAGEGMVNQLTPWSAQVYYWGNNANWFGADVYGRPLIYDFILVNGLPVEAVRDNFGPPDAQVSCGTLDVWIYRDPERLWSQVEPAIFSLLAKRLALGQSVDLPLGVFRSLVGQSDSNGRSFRADKDRGGYLMFGPYWNIQKGTYHFKISYTYQPDAQRAAVATWDLASDNGRRILQAGPFTKAGDHVSEDLTLVLDRDRDAFELRVYVKDAPYFAVHAVELTKSF